ncbi:pyrroline-5-carboxylate reductase family protein [Maliponia aquimaris]|uniref:Pyrroline-5-carboxylate reductase n=1 Tax=Maliponia aquimaris TaxID=1673631 RepID=A0A238KZH3_9RHOB|nr:pyrroline-5-carboxylate reductase dimerization domain-containing protein [Maliponia aquimaris]SMX48169.1 Pyrroline-5-carboxylate reductase [Maliponia aquimaris]
MTWRMALVGATGWLGRSIGPSLLRHGVVRAGMLTCVSRSGASPLYDAWPGVRWRSEVGPAEVVILSVRPQQFREADFDCSGALVLSLMAGVSCAEIAERTGARVVVRTMPNAAVEIERSYSPWFCPQVLGDQDRARVTAILTAIGTTDELAREADLDVITALSGAGPAWPALLAAALYEAGKAGGLSAEVAGHAAEAVVCAASDLLAGRVAQAGALVQEFIDYRGTTAAAMLAARAGGFDAAIAAGVAAGTAKARDLSS